MAGLDTEVGRKSAKADTAESDESNPRELLCSRSILVDSSSGGNDHSNRKGSNVSLSAGRGKSASSSNKRSERPELLDGSPSESDGPSTRMAAHADKPASNPAEIFQSEDNKADPEESDDAGSARVDKKEKQGLRKGKWAVR